MTGSNSATESCDAMPLHNGIELARYCEIVGRIAYGEPNCLIGM